MLLLPLPRECRRARHWFRSSSNLTDPVLALKGKVSTPTAAYPSSKHIRTRRARSAASEPAERATRSTKPLRRRTVLNLRVASPHLGAWSAEHKGVVWASSPSETTGRPSWLQGQLHRLGSAASFAARGRATDVVPARTALQRGRRGRGAPPESGPTRQRVTSIPPRGTQLKVGSSQSTPRGRPVGGCREPVYFPSSCGSSRPIRRPCTNRSLASRSRLSP